MDIRSMKRKELQSLCKKHGVPANLSNLEMVNRLESLFKEEEKPLNRGKSCLKPSKAVDCEDGSKEKKHKKVRFSPENELIEILGSESDSDVENDVHSERVMRRKSKLRIRRKSLTSKMGEDESGVGEGENVPIINNNTTRGKRTRNSAKAADHVMHVNVDGEDKTIKHEASMRQSRRNMSKAGDSAMDVVSENKRIVWDGKTPKLEIAVRRSRRNFDMIDDSAKAVDGIVPVDVIGENKGTARDCKTSKAEIAVRRSRRNVGRADDSAKTVDEIMPVDVIHERKHITSNGETSKPEMAVRRSRRNLGRADDSANTVDENMPVGESSEVNGLARHDEPSKLEITVRRSRCNVGRADDFAKTVDEIMPVDVIHERKHITRNGETSKPEMAVRRSRRNLGRADDSANTVDENVPVEESSEVNGLARHDETSKPEMAVRRSRRNMIKVDDSALLGKKSGGQGVTRVTRSRTQVVQEEEDISVARSEIEMKRQPRKCSRGEESVVDVMEVPVENASVSLPRSPLIKFGGNKSVANYVASTMEVLGFENARRNKQPGNLGKALLSDEAAEVGGALRRSRRIGSRIDSVAAPNGRDRTSEVVRTNRQKKQKRESIEESENLGEVLLGNKTFEDGEPLRRPAQNGLKSTKAANRIDRTVEVVRTDGQNKQGKEPILQSKDLGYVDLDDGSLEVGEPLRSRQNCSRIGLTSSTNGMDETSEPVKGNEQPKLEADVIAEQGSFATKCPVIEVPGRRSTHWTPKEFNVAASGVTRTAAEDKRLSELEVLDSEVEVESEKGTSAPEVSSATDVMYSPAFSGHANMPYLGTLEDKSPNVEKRNVSAAKCSMEKPNEFEEQIPVVCDLKQVPENVDVFLPESFAPSSGKEIEICSGESVDFAEQEEIAVEEGEENLLLDIICEKDTDDLESRSWNSTGGFDYNNVSESQVAELESDTTVEVSSQTVPEAGACFSPHKSDHADTGIEVKREEEPQSTSIVAGQATNKGNANELVLGDQLGKYSLKDSAMEFLEDYVLVAPEEVVPQFLESKNTATVLMDESHQDEAENFALQEIASESDSTLTNRATGESKGNRAIEISRSPIDPTPSKPLFPECNAMPTEDEAIYSCGRTLPVDNGEQKQDGSCLKAKLSESPNVLERGIKPTEGEKLFRAETVDIARTPANDLCKEENAEVPVTLIGSEDGATSHVERTWLQFGEQAALEDIGEASAVELSIALGCTTNTNCPLSSGSENDAAEKGTVYEQKMKMCMHDGSNSKDIKTKRVESLLTSGTNQACEGMQHASVACEHAVSSDTDVYEQEGYDVEELFRTPADKKCIQESLCWEKEPVVRIMSKGKNTIASTGAVMMSLKKSEGTVEGKDYRQKDLFGVTVLPKEDVPSESAKEHPVSSDTDVYEQEVYDIDLFGTPANTKHIEETFCCENKLVMRTLSKGRNAVGSARPVIMSLRKSEGSMEGKDNEQKDMSRMTVLSNEEVSSEGAEEEFVDSMADDHMAPFSDSSISGCDPDVKDESELHADDDIQGAEASQLSGVAPPIPSYAPKNFASGICIIEMSSSKREDGGDSKDNDVFCQGLTQITMSSGLEDSQYQLTVPASQEIRTEKDPPGNMTEDDITDESGGSLGATHGEEAIPKNATSEWESEMDGVNEIREPESTTWLPSHCSIVMEDSEFAHLVDSSNLAFSRQKSGEFSTKEIGKLGIISCPRQPLAVVADQDCPVVLSEIRISGLDDCTDQVEKKSGTADEFCEESEASEEKGIIDDISSPSISINRMSIGLSGRGEIRLAGARVDENCSRITGENVTVGGNNNINGNEDDGLNNKGHSDVLDVPVDANQDKSGQLYEHDDEKDDDAHKYKSSEESNEQITGSLNSIQRRIEEQETKEGSSPLGPTRPSKVDIDCGEDIQTFSGDLPDAPGKLVCQDSPHEEMSYDSGVLEEEIDEVELGIDVNTEDVVPKLEKGASFPREELINEDEVGTVKEYDGTGGCSPSNMVSDEDAGTEVQSNDLKSGVHGGAVVFELEKCFALGEHIVDDEITDKNDEGIEGSTSFEEMMVTELRNSASIVLEEQLMLELANKNNRAICGIHLEDTVAYDMGKSGTLVSVDHIMHLHTANGIQATTEGNICLEDIPSDFNNENADTWLQVATKHSDDAEALPDTANETDLMNKDGYCQKSDTFNVSSPGSQADVKTLADTCSSKLEIGGNNEQHFLEDIIDNAEGKQITGAEVISDNEFSNIHKESGDGKLEVSLASYEFSGWEINLFCLENEKEEVNPSTERRSEQKFRELGGTALKPGPSIKEQSLVIASIAETDVTAQGSDASPQKFQSVPPDSQREDKMSFFSKQLESSVNVEKNFRTVLTQTTPRKKLPGMLRSDPKENTAMLDMKINTPNPTVKGKQMSGIPSVKSAVKRRALEDIRNN